MKNNLQVQYNLINLAILLLYTVSPVSVPTYSNKDITRFFNLEFNNKSIWIIHFFIFIRMRIYSIKWMTSTSLENYKYMEFLRETINIYQHISFLFISV